MDTGVHRYDNNRLVIVKKNEVRNYVIPLKSLPRKVVIQGSNPESVGTKISKGDIMKIKKRILNFFKTHWMVKRFMKAASMAVLVCFARGMIGSNFAYAQKRPIEQTEASYMQYFGVQDRDEAIGLKFAAARQLAKLTVDGVTRSADISQVLTYALAIWKDTDAMARRLNLKISDANVQTITENYQREIYKVVKFGELTPEETVAEVKLLSILRDIFIAVSKEAGEGDLKSLLDKEELTVEEFKIIMEIIAVNKIVNHSATVKGFAKANANKKFSINMNDLRLALSDKTAEQERLSNLFKKNTMDELLNPGRLVSDERLRKHRGIITSPMTAKAILNSRVAWN